MLMSKSVWQMNELLRRIKLMYTINRDFDRRSSIMKKASLYGVPIRQNKASLITPFLKSFSDVSGQYFYDVSAWTLPLAYDVQYLL